MNITFFVDYSILNGRIGAKLFLSISKFMSVECLLLTQGGIYPPSAAVGLQREGKIT